VKGAHSVRISAAGNEKQSYSVMLCASATGQKLPATVVLARSRPLKQVERDNSRHLALMYTGCGGGTWYNEHLILQWLGKNFKVSCDLNRPRHYHHFQAPLFQKRRLLIWDAFRAHRTPAVRQAASVQSLDLAYVPPCCTGLVQPADISWNKSFKV